MRAAKVDKNQSDIVKALRDCGASVALLHAVGKGMPDLLVGYRQENYLLEVKDVKGRVNPLQSKWHLEWRGHAFVVRTPVEALYAIGAIQ